MANWPYNTARWQTVRSLKLAAQPLCEGCYPHRLTPANTVDHIHPISDGGPAFPGLDGLRSLCPSCHGAKTARGVEAGAIKTDKPRKGCDANGNPLDAAHPWAGESLKAGGIRPAGNRNTQLVNLNARTQGRTAPADRHSLHSGAASQSKASDGSNLSAGTAQSQGAAPTWRPFGNEGIRPADGNYAGQNHRDFQDVCCSPTAKNTRGTDSQGGEHG